MVETVLVGAGVCSAFRDAFSEPGRALLLSQTLNMTCGDTITGYAPLLGPDIQVCGGCYTCKHLVRLNGRCCWGHSSLWGLTVGLDLGALSESLSVELFFQAIECWGGVDEVGMDSTCIVDSLGPNIQMCGR